MKETASQVPERESNADGQSARAERVPQSDARVSQAQTSDAHAEPVQDQETTCIECGRTAVERRTVFEHKPCGHIGQREAFAGSGETDCRGCGQSTADGSVVAVGVVYPCDNCGQVYDRPVHESIDDE